MQYIIKLLAAISELIGPKLQGLMLLLGDLKIITGYITTVTKDWSVDKAIAFFDELRHFFDMRVIVLALLLAGTGYLLFNESQIPLIISALQFGLVLVLGALIAHLVRKLVLDNSIRMSEFAQKAKDGSMPSALVLIGLLWFTYSLINLTVLKILP
jgi:hypothetical protein